MTEHCHCAPRHCHCVASPYVICWSTQGISNLAAIVNRKLVEGYVPQGGVCYDGLTYQQAVYMPPYENRGDRGPG